MTDQQFNMLSIAGIALVLWYLFKGRNVNAISVPPTQSPALPISFQDPMGAPYAADPSAFAPTTPQQLAVNIGNQSAAMLDQRYIPLFGFVGMAQGTLYQ